MADAYLFEEKQERVGLVIAAESDPGQPSWQPVEMLRFQSLCDVFLSSVVRWPDRPALEDSRRQLSYADLAGEASALATRLARAGIGPGDRVGVRIPSGTADLHVAILGCLLSGAAYVPADSDDPEDRASAIWQSADVCAVLTEGLELIQDRPGEQRSGPPTPDDDCWVIFTSGSTGTPKGVAVTHGSAVAFVEAETRLWEVEPTDRVLAGLSVAFDASCEEMWLAWRNGATLVPCPRSVVRSGVDLGPWLSSHAITVVSTVPTLAAMWNEAVLASVRLLVLGGEACPPELGWRLAADREVWNTYGPTEATVVSTAARVEVGRPITIGTPLAGWDVAVVDDAEQPVADGVVGELVIGGVGLGRYLDPELDATRFAPLWARGWDRAYRTGDIVRQGSDGLEFVGRRDDQVKVGGRRIELGEIDAALLALPGVRAAATITRTTAAGTTVLVGYVVGEVDLAAARTELGRRLPPALVPILVPLDALPTKSSGKVDRSALPWPPPSRADASRFSGTATTASELSGTAGWLAEQWRLQLGPADLDLESDFFDLGGTSLAVAQLVSVLRASYPSLAVADVYTHRTLGGLAAHLDQLSAPAPTGLASVHSPRGRGGLRLAGLVGVAAVVGLQWLVGLFAYDQWYRVGPQIGWVAIVALWLLALTVPGRVAIVALARRLLLGRLRPGRYSREGWLASRLWFVERLAELLHMDVVGGTPWAPRIGRAFGVYVGAGARLGTAPPATALLEVGPGATLEGDVDVHGWWVRGEELVLDRIRVGANARIGARSVLMPGADIGEGAEIEPGSVVEGYVPAGERWAGSPLRRVGRAGETWADEALPVVDTPPVSEARYALGLTAVTLLPFLAAVPSLLVAGAAGNLGTLAGALHAALLVAPVLAVTFTLTYAGLVAAIVRYAGRRIRPGVHADSGGTAWALWLTHTVTAQARTVLFPLYSSVYTRGWLRLLGIEVGRRTEVSTAVGLHHLVRLGETSFVTDDVTFATTRARGGWLEVAPIEVGDRSFIGNSAVIGSGTVLGDNTLVGALSTPPRSSAAGTSWLGLPAIELPRTAEATDPARTTTPPRRLVVARGALEALRIFLPLSVATVIGVLAFAGLAGLGRLGGGLAMAAAAPFVVLIAGGCAVGFTVAAKWVLMGRYRPSAHPLWSSYVWRDELVNTFHEQLAGAWLLVHAVGTPLLPLYIRLMGGRVGRRVWFESLNVTEFDLVELEDHCVVNRGAVVETHLFHDRLFRTGPARLGTGATLGPHSTALPDTELGAGCVVGARSVVLRGETLPPESAWQGIPVQAATTSAELPG